MTQDTTFDPLQALSLARTALSDPAGMPEGEPDFFGGAVASEDHPEAMYAIDRIDEVIGALRFEGALNDYQGEARWVLTHLGRLLAAVADTLGNGTEMLPAANEDAASYLQEAGDRIDEAIDAL